jgi:LPS export ABC transporter protein LptC
MRLQRIGFHRAVRILSGVLPVLIVGLVGVAGWNYWASSRDNPRVVPVRPQQPLSEEVAVHTGVFKFTRNEDGKDKFTITGSELTSYRDKHHLLNNVEVTIHSQKEGEPDRHIHGKECKYSEGADVRCDGNVSVQLDETTTAYTEQLDYDSTTGLIFSPVATRLERPGHMKGRSGDMQYFTNTGLLRLTKQADIELVDGGSLHGGIAVFQQKENWATISQGLEVSSPNGWIRGGSGRAELSPGTYRPTKVTVENGASMESRSSRSLLSMSSDWMQSDMTAEGKPEHVVARGKVHTENKRNPDAQSKPAGDEEASGSTFQGTLDSPEMEAWLNDQGRFSKIDARQKPVLVGEQGTLTAENAMHIDNAGSVTTEGASKLTGDIGIEGRDFTLKNSNNIRTFTTSHRATLISDGTTTKGDTTVARIDAQTRKLISLEQTGKVTLEDPKENRKGHSGKLTVDEEKMVLERDMPEVTTEQGVLKSDRITVFQKTKKFIGEGNVTMADTKAKGKPTVIVAEHVDGNDVQVDYKGKVSLVPPDRGQVNADHLRLFPKENRFEADGHVSSLGTGFNASSDSLSVVDMGNDLQTAHYRGDVKATRAAVKQGKDLVLTTQDLEVHLKAGQMENLVAMGKVTMNQKPARSGKGDRLDYNEITGEIILTGSDASQAELHDGESLLIGCQILMMRDSAVKSVTQCKNGSVKSTIDPNKKN